MVLKRIIGRVHLEMEATITQIVDATTPLVKAAERQRELEAVQAVRDGVASETDGVAGIENSLSALEDGQVMTLVMNEDLQRAGWAGYTLPLYGVGTIPDEHPAGGDIDNIVATTLADEVIRLAIGTDAAVELVRSGMPNVPEERERIPHADEAPPLYEAALALDALGGIGGTLRYSP